MPYFAVRGLEGSRSLCCRRDVNLEDFLSETEMQGMFTVLLSFLFISQNEQKGGQRLGGPAERICHWQDSSSR